MARYSGTITDDNGVYLAGARVLVQVTGTGQLATLTDDSGNPLLNPSTTDALGSFVFNVPDGYYDLTYQAARGGRIIREYFNQIIGAPIDSGYIATVQESQASFISAGTTSLTTVGYRSAFDLGGATYARVPSNPNLAGSFRSLDRFLPDGAISPANGGWWKMVGDIANICAFGAVGDNDTAKATANTQAVNNAISWSAAQTFPVPIYSPPGQYQFNGPLTPISRGVTIKGAGARSSIWVFSGNYDCITFRGASGIRCANACINAMSVYADNMTGGNAVAIDFAQAFVIADSYISNPYNGISIRQTGGFTMLNTNIQACRGIYGIKAYGTGAPRNNSVVSVEIDKIDVLDFLNVVIEGDYVPGSGTAICDLVWLDGYVQTMNWSSMRLIHGLRGIRTSNTPNVANPLYPSFLNGSDLEFESFWQQPLYLDYCSRFWATGVYVTGCDSKEGIYLGSNVHQVKIFGGECRDNYLDGMISNALYVETHGFDIFRNAQAGTGNWDGVKVNGGTFRSYGGLIGKNVAEPTYTENQHYGVNNVGGSSVAIYGVIASGNGAAATNGTVTVA